MVQHGAMLNTLFLAGTLLKSQLALSYSYMWKLKVKNKKGQEKLTLWLTFKSSTTRYYIYRTR